MRNRTIIDDMNMRCDDYIKRNNELEIDSNQLPHLNQNIEEKSKLITELETRISTICIDRDNMTSQMHQENEKYAFMNPPFPIIFSIQPPNPSVSKFCSQK